MQRRVETLAALLSALGLGRGDVVGLHAPASVDGYLAALAVMRAGLVLQPLPLHLSSAEIDRAVNTTSTRAIVTAGLLDGQDRGAMMRDIASARFSVRHLLGIGDDLADGVLDLAGVLAGDAEFGPVPEAPQLDDIVALFPEAAGDSPMPWTARSLAAAADAVALEAGLEPDAVVLSPLLPARPAAFAVLGACARTGAGLALCPPSSGASLAAAAVAARADFVVVPGSLAAEIAALLPGGPTIVAVHDAEASGFSRAADEARIVDVWAPGARTLLPRQREPGAAALLLPEGPCRFPSRDPAGRVLAELRRVEGRMQISGPLAAGADAGVGQEIEIAAEAEAGMLRIAPGLRRKDDLASIADRLRAELPVTALALRSAEEPTAGRRIVGYLVPAPGAIIDAAMVEAACDRLDIPSALRPETLRIASAATGEPAEPRQRAADAAA